MNTKLLSLAILFPAAWTAASRLTTREALPPPLWPVAPPAKTGRHGRRTWGVRLQADRLDVNVGSASRRTVVIRERRDGTRASTCTGRRRCGG